MSIAHAKGDTDLAARPEKVIVFDLASLDTLSTLGVAVAGVPAGPKPPVLARYAGSDYAKVGSLFEPDYEALNAAEPDLVIVGGRSGSKYAEVAKMAPTIDLTVDPKNYLASMKRNAETLGRIFGKQTEVSERLAKLDASIAELKGKSASAGTGLIVLTTGGKMSAYGPGSRFGMLHDEFGVTPAVADLTPGNHGQSISFEFIQKTDPDWLFVLDRDAAIGREGEAASKLLDNDLVGQTKAWKSGQVVYLDAASWYLVGGGLTTMQMIVDQISEALTKA
nr:siderophore ABC transporter substrate-binding protein [Aureimonas glaciei]